VCVGKKSFLVEEDKSKKREYLYEKGVGKRVTGSTDIYFKPKIKHVGDWKRRFGR
jgi:hypothetical protein